MKKMIEEKLQMCKEHVEEGKSLSHVCELSKIKLWIIRLIVYNKCVIIGGDNELYAWYG